MAVAECEEDNPPKPRAQEGMLRRIPPKNMEVPRALPVGLHIRLNVIADLWVSKPCLAGDLTQDGRTVGGHFSQRRIPQILLCYCYSDLQG